MSPKKESTNPPSATHVEEVRAGIEHTRDEMSATLGALEERLSPSVLGEKASAELHDLEARVKSVMKEGIDAAKEAVKEGVHDAKDAVSESLKDARDSVKKDIQDAITHTKQSVREATLGRVETFATKAGDVMNDSRDTLIDTIRQNPIPAALTGLGIAWLLMNRSSASRRQSGRYGSMRGNGPYAGIGYGPEAGIAYGRSDVMAGRPHRAEQVVAQTAERIAHGAGSVAGDISHAAGHAGASVADAAHRVGDAAKHAVDQGREAVSHMAHDATATAARFAHDASGEVSHLAHGAAEGAAQLAHRAHEAAGSFAGSARERATHLEEGLLQSWEANPLAYGAAALMAGAALGYALPRTQKEDELMGETRDMAIHNAAESAGHAIRSAEHFAEEIAKGAKDLAKTATTTRQS